MKKSIFSLCFVLALVMILGGCKKETDDENNQSGDASIRQEVAEEEVDYETLSVKELELRTIEGDGEAACRLGQIYDYGLEGETQNFQKAFACYEASAKAGVGDGYLGLGYMYLNGAGVFADYDMALENFNNALALHCKEANAAIGRTYLMMGDESRYRQAYTYFKVASEEGVLDGTCYLGYLYENGITVQQNVDMAMLAYAAVLKSDSTDIRDQYAINVAHTRLGIIYASGKGDHLDEKEAISHFTKASENGYAQATYYLGTMYQMGRGTDRDYEKALACYERAAESDYAPALSQIGYFYFNGLGVDTDYGQAVYYEKLAAAQGYAPAEVNLGFLYENGLGVEKNQDTALQYYQMAKNQGYEGASEAVTRVENLMRGR